MTTPTSDSQTNPYVGPRTFTSTDRRRFFGRDTEAASLLARVVSERLLLFYAQSGAGKSSLINARLIPALREEEGFSVLPVGRVVGQLPVGVEAVDNIFLFNLMSSLDQRVNNPERLAHLGLVEFLNQIITDDGLTWRYEPTGAEMVETQSAIEETELPPRFALIIDQFEEIITGHADRWREREEFFRQIDAALQANPTLWVVLSLREDYVAALDPYAPLTFNRLRARFYMERMGVAAALDAIRKPADLGRRPFALGVAEKLVDDLRQVRVPGQESTVAGQHVEPVQLQVVCYQMWEKLAKGTEESQITFKDLAEAGDVNQALIQFYVETLAAALADPAAAGMSERQLRGWFDKKLITEAGTRGLVHQGEVETGGLPNGVVRVLQKQFLVRAEARGDGVWIELVHDRLVESVRESNAGWQANYYNPLDAATKSWIANGRSPNHLLSGTQLVQAQAFAKTHHGELTQNEQSLLTESVRETIRKTTLRRRIAIVTGTVIITLSILSLWALRNAAKAQEQARVADSRALAAQAVSDFAVDPERSILLALEALEREYTDGAELALRRALIVSRIERRFSDEGNAFWDVAVVPGDAIRLAAGGSDNTITLWNTTSLTSTVPSARLRGHTGQILGIDVDPSSSRLASASADGTAKVWDLATEDVIFTLENHFGPVRDVEFSPDGRFLATASLDGYMRLWDAENGNLVFESAAGHQGEAVNGLAYSPNGQLLATGGDDNNVTVWRILDRSAVPQLTLLGHTDGIYDVAFHPSKPLLASVSRDKTTRIWDISEDAAATSPKLTLYGHTDTIFDVSFSTNGRCLATASLDRTVKLWDTDSGRLLQTLSGHDADVFGVTFLPESGIPEEAPTQLCGLELATASSDGTIRIWNIAASGEQQPLVGHTDAVETVVYSPDETLLATGGSDGAAIFWDSKSGKLLFELHGHDDRVNRVAFSPDGKILATASYDGTVKLWSTATGKNLRTLVGHADRVQGVDFSPDGRTIVSVGSDGNIILWDAASGEVTDSLSIYEDGTELYDVAFGPNAAFLVVAGENYEAIVMGLNPLDLLAVLPHDDAVYDVAFSPDGTRFATASWDEKTRVWSAVTPWELQQTLIGHADRVFGVAFSRDGKRLATASADQTAIVWDSDTGNLLKILPGAGEELNSPAFSADGNTLVVGGDDGTVRVYLLQLDNLIDAARSRLTRKLTASECDIYLHSTDCTPRR
ncbi:MAG: WD40 repeat domain-containing protein [Caldilineaceae bacterium]|nr:WD40 repeat domain-containing protein [Caldilineaceae bacterium]MBP8106549.1 WD40 repeat domain-containing protein [Caldilineaceae bacterium]MBP8121571.1 WD40 repeat domain-containing protein [Caldilineaceae bacterium]MBP9071394.1 WD40 repeat domain-containing protein [Caldilineaceae bacterium]